MIDPISRYLHHRSGQHGPVILMYHSVAPGTGTPDWPWAVSIRQFRNQLDFLAAEGWATPTMAELVATPDKWSGRTAVITFDDGYIDNLAAWEALQKRGMKATWFIVTGSIGREPLWPADGRPTGRLLNADELRVMAASGMEIASHTVSHVQIPTMDDLTMKKELVDSKVTLEDILEHEVPGFAYPYGAWDARCEQVVRQAGYLYACTTQSGWALRDTAYQIRRLTVFNRDATSTLARKLYFGSNDASWYKAASHLVDRLRVRIIS